MWRSANPLFSCTTLPSDSSLQGPITTNNVPAASVECYYCSRTSPASPLICHWVYHHLPVHSRTPRSSLQIELVAFMHLTCFSSIDHSFRLTNQIHLLCEPDTMSQLAKNLVCTVLATEGLRSSRPPSWTYFSIL